MVLHKKYEQVDGVDGEVTTVLFFRSVFISLEEHMTINFRPRPQSLLTLLKTKAMST